MVPLVFDPQPSGNKTSETLRCNVSKPSYVREMRKNRLGRAEPAISTPSGQSKRPRTTSCSTLPDHLGATNFRKTRGGPSHTTCSRRFPFFKGNWPNPVLPHKVSTTQVLRRPPAPPAPPTAPQRPASIRRRRPGDLQPGPPGRRGPRLRRIRRPGRCERLSRGSGWADSRSHLISIWPMGPNPNRTPSEHPIQSPHRLTWLVHRKPQHGTKTVLTHSHMMTGKPYVQLILGPYWLGPAAWVRLSGPFQFLFVVSSLGL